uniref:Reverse transcriptase domain-containing protein n=1 Tax=Tanacetum cinerariifolium TaxID=118510 RepID=A0A6L2MYL0_TANCI|nr:hypothetical protein [Tanacetum cinerariifolium]
MCDVPFHDNSPSLDISKDQFEDFSESNEDSTSIDDDSFFIDDIEYVEASPPDSKLVSLEETSTFDNSLPKSKTFCFDSEENSSGSTTTRFDISLLDYEAFYDDHVKEIISGSTTTYLDVSLYDSFIFDLSINPFPLADRSDFYEFADELAHIRSLSEYDCFSFKNEPNSGDFTIDVVEDIFPTREPRVHIHNVLPTHPTLPLNLDIILSSEFLFTYVVKNIKEKNKIKAKTGQNQEQTKSVKKSKVKPDKVKAKSKPKRDQVKENITLGTKIAKS